MSGVVDRGRYVRIDAVDDETLYVAHAAVDSEACAYCGRPTDRPSGESRGAMRRLSTGFGMANEILLWFCGRRCRGMLALRGRARDVEPPTPWRDPEQATLATATPPPARSRTVAVDGGVAP